MITISDAQYGRLCRITGQLSGIELDAGKRTMATSRLQPRLRELKITEFASYLSLVERNSVEAGRMIDLLSTNVTSFWREPTHFPVLEQFLAQRVAAGARRIRLWCAAAATGEEPWTMAMLLHDAMAARTIDAAILATDISSRALETSKAGVYRAESVARLPENLRAKHLTTIAEGKVCIADHLRSMVTFNRLNLIRPPYPMRGQFDAIFCRNVMIYFDHENRGLVVQHLKQFLLPGGLLCVGAAESLSGLDHGLRQISPAAYVLT